VSFLLDTNVVSEWVKLRPDPGLIAWCESVDEDRTFISMVTLAELRYGTERLSAGARRTGLEDWLDNELPARFEGRILPIDAAIAHAWEKAVAHGDREGRPSNTMDAFLAATAEIHHLTLVTRNATDFRGVTKSVMNPWKS
jgi:toxin FitB